MHFLGQGVMGSSHPAHVSTSQDRWMDGLHKLIRPSRVRRDSSPWPERAPRGSHATLQVRPSLRQALLQQFLPLRDPSPRQSQLQPAQPLFSLIFWLTGKVPSVQYFAVIFSLKQFPSDTEIRDFQIHFPPTSLSPGISFSFWLPCNL